MFLTCLLNDYWPGRRRKDQTNRQDRCGSNSKPLPGHEVKDFVAEYGHFIVDECHHLSAFTFEKVMRQVRARFVIGLTATPTRKDGHHPIIYMQCGPARFTMSARAMTDATPFEHVVVPRITHFRMERRSTRAVRFRMFTPRLSRTAIVMI